MFTFEDPDTLWLNLINVALGVVTLICLAIVGKVVVSELALRAKAKALAFNHDDHAFFVPELGLTMADGGKPIAEQSFVREDGTIVNEPTNDENDPPNIHRSEN